jgi:hypothetical protein
MTTLATLHARDQAGLDALPEHDAYFDVNDREFDAASRTLSLPFSQRVDQIVGVEGLPAARQTRRTRRFEEHRDEERSRLRILTVTGPEHVIDVDRLEIEVEIIDQVDCQLRVRTGRLIGVETERCWK